MWKQVDEEEILNLREKEEIQEPLVHRIACGVVLTFVIVGEPTTSHTNMLSERFKKSPCIREPNDLLSLSRTLNDGRTVPWQRIVLLVVNFSEEPSTFIVRLELKVYATDFLKFVEHLSDLVVSLPVSLDSREYGRSFSQY